MKQVMNYHKDNGLLNMIRRTDPMINMPRMGRVPNENRGRNQKPVPVILISPFIPPIFSVKYHR